MRILRDMEEVSFAGFVEARDDRAAEVSAELGVRRYEDEASLLADVDAVTIVVPTPAHYSVAKAALDAGKHVFIEKPITATIEQAEEL
ncbi:MAG TPA: Gfo/Idh/MocA family oxidoreductase, partial [Gemmatimonadaceae bacterium]